MDGEIITREVHETPTETSIVARKLWVKGAATEDGAALVELGQDHQTGEITSLTLRVPAEDGTPALVTLDGQQVAGLLETIEWTAPDTIAKLAGYCAESGARRKDCNACRSEDDAKTALLGEYGDDAFPFELDQEESQS